MPTPLLLRRRRGIASAFNPLTQVSALHAMWANDPLWTNPGDGNTVASIRNQSGGGDPAQATEANKPIFRSSVAALNNRSAWEFDGSTDLLDVDVTDVAQPFKVLLVAKLVTTPTSTSTVGYGHGSTASLGIGVSAGGFWFCSSATVLTSAVGRDSNPHVFRATHNGASSQLWLDETSIASGSAGTSTFRRLRLGCSGTDGSPSRFCNVQIGFYAIYDGTATSDTDLADLADDLATYYGTP